MVQSLGFGVQGLRLSSRAIYNDGHVSTEESVTLEYFSKNVWHRHFLGLIYIYVCMYIYIYIYLCVCVGACVRVCVCAQACMHVSRL